MKINTLPATAAALLAALPALAGSSSVASAADMTPKHAYSTPLVGNDFSALRALMAPFEKLDADGNAAIAAGDYAAAEADFRQAIAYGEAKINMAWPDSVYGLAESLADQGRTAEAMQTYASQIKLEAYGPGESPNNAEVTATLKYVVLLDHAGRWPEAVAFYKQALPGVADGRILQADCAFDPTVPQPAVLEAAARIAYAVDADFRRVISHEVALTEFTKALQLAPGWDLANYYYGQELETLGRTAEARAAFTKTVKIAKGDVKAAAQKALARSKKPV